MLSIKGNPAMNIPQMSTVGNYELEFPIGRGGNSFVYQGRNMKTNEYVALKFINREKLKDVFFLENIEKELRIFERLSHPGITKYIETIYLQDYIVIVQELLTGGTLGNLSQCTFHQVDTQLILRWAKEILETIEYLHANGISHCDIKPSNIGFDRYHHPKIFDFGLCSETKRSNRMYKCGTPMFAAPEVYSNTIHDEYKADIWSYGVTIYVLATNTFPFHAHDEESFLANMRKPNFVNIKLTGPLKDLMEMTLQVDPEKRFSAKAILESNIFKDIQTYPGKRASFSLTKSSTPFQNTLTRRNIGKHIPYIVAPISRSLNPPKKVTKYLYE